MKNRYINSFIVSLLLITNCPLRAQIFTRVTATTNPIVVDADRSGGGSWIDIDNDGDLDLYVSNGNLNLQNNALYINNGSGNFSKFITGSIVTDGGSSIGSTWADVNNDGNLDCFVTNRNNIGNYAYMGNGTPNPTKVTGIPMVTDIANSNAGSWVDIDNDGDLDLYVINFQGNDYLYLNSGASSYTFSNNQSNAIQLDGSAFSISGTWADYNNDRKPDLYVANAGGQNDKLYTNNGGLSFTTYTFTDLKTNMGGSWCDYDNDGDLDLFTTSFLSQASVLYNNSGAPNYSLTSVVSTVQATGNSVGSAFGDVDNDGDQDLIVCNDGANNKLYINSGFPSYTFTPVPTEQIVSDGGSSFGCAIGDYDNDGHLDVFVANQNNTLNFLYHNNGNSNNWITIKCLGVVNNQSAIGAKVFVKANIGGNNIWQMQEVAAQTGYNSQNLYLHFGLGNASLVDTIITKWPNGQNDTCYNIPANKLYTSTESACPLVFPLGLVNLNNDNEDLVSLYPNPANDILSISSKNETTSDTIELFDIAGKMVVSYYNQETINISWLQSGVYFARIHFGSRVINKKLLISH